MAVRYEFGGKDKLIKGQTYPIKRSEFDATLDAAGVTELEHVSYYCSFEPREERQRFIWTHMMGEAQIPGTIIRRSPTVYIGSVNKNDLPWIKEELVNRQILKKMGQWLKQLEDAENVRRDRDQHFNVYIAKDTLIVEKS